MEGAKQVPPLVRGRGLQRRDGSHQPAFPAGARRNPGCLLNATPEDTVNFTPKGAVGTNPNTAVLSDIEAFADFMRMLAPPVPAPDTASTASGRAIFTKIGCAHCHTPSFTTRKMIASGSSKSPSVALSNQPVRLWSDLIIHHMGKALADGITQGSAGPDEFRTAPLWGLGQRVFFMHDGRTSDLLQVIEEHRSPAARQPRSSNSFEG
jgi:CxxC motif-containing protein (DUF1111 family)